MSSSSSRRFEKPGDIRRGFHEAGFLRIGDKLLHRRTRNFARENNAFPACAISSADISLRDFFRFVSAPLISTGDSPAYLFTLAPRLELP